MWTVSDFSGCPVSHRQRIISFNEAKTILNEVENNHDSTK